MLIACFFSHCVAHTVACALPPAPCLACLSLRWRLFLLYKWRSSSPGTLQRVKRVEACARVRCHARCALLCSLLLLSAVLALLCDCVLLLGRCRSFLPLSCFSALNRYACLFAALTRPVKQLCGYRLYKIERLGEPESFGMLSAPPSLYFSISRFSVRV